MKAARQGLERSVKHLLFFQRANMAPPERFPGVCIWSPWPVAGGRDIKHQPWYYLAGIPVGFGLTPPLTHTQNQRTTPSHNRLRLPSSPINRFYLPLHNRRKSLLRLDRSILSTHLHFLAAHIGFYMYVWFGWTLCCIFFYMSKRERSSGPLTTKWCCVFENFHL